MPRTILHFHVPLATALIGKVSKPPLKGRNVPHFRAFQLQSDIRREYSKFMPWPCPFEFQLQKNFSNSIWTPSLLVDNTAVQWFLCLFLYLVTQHQRILPGFTSIHLWRERVVCITPQCSTITPIQLMCVLSGPFGLRDGLGSTCVLLQERTCLRTFAHIKHKWRRHMDKTGFSSVQLEGPSASCLPWLPTALHSATSKDGL